LTLQIKYWERAFQCYGLSKAQYLKFGAVLTPRFINALEWDQVMEKLGYDRAHVNRMHTGALWALQEAITAKESAAR